MKTVIGYYGRNGNEKTISVEQIETDKKKEITDKEYEKMFMDGE